MRRGFIICSLMLLVSFSIRAAFADGVDDKLKSLEQQMKALQAQINELKAQREADKQEITSLKAEAEEKGLEGILEMPENSGVMITGYIDLEYKDAQNAVSSFDNIHFEPIFLGMVGDNLLTEVALEWEHGGEEKAEVEYAQIDYLFNDYITFVGGRFLVPFGVYNERLHPTWIAKLPTRPLPENDIVPVGWSEVGVQLRGAVPLRINLPFTEYAKLDYTTYVINGLEGTEGAGIRDLRGNTRDNNQNKAVGGRVGLTFLPHLDLGFSWYKGDYTTTNNRDLTMLGLDSAFYWDNLTIRGEYVTADQEVGALSGLTDLKKEGFYVEGAYFLSAIPLPFMNKTELVAQYSEENLDTFSTSTQLLDSSDKHRWAVGLNYYIKDAFRFQMAYNFNAEDKGTKTKDNEVIARLALGF